ncbi:hypothetical protein [Roseivirga misakiensis]|uniref:hypothetical protein n=1 Tax=Roseivirga misakiensis TaxID=1563681 RepID=UPI00114CB71D|nr:hypothetical protein [Roseivirga misakiensis]
MNLKLLKANLIIAFALFSTALLGQENGVKTSFDIDYKPVMASIDRQGNLYFANAGGAIDKYDQDGKLLYHFSPQRKSKPSIIEAWQELRIFVHYKDLQQYLFLDRFLNNSERYSLDFSQSNNFSGHVTLSGDNNLWAINEQELSLQKIDINNQEVLFETKLNLQLDFDHLEVQFIRDYQNYLFISDAELGVLMFDNLGNYIEQIIPKADIAFFSFSKNELIYLTHRKLILRDIYTKKEREIRIPDLPYQFAFMENNKLFLIRNQTVDLVKIN